MSELKSVTWQSAADISVGFAMQCILPLSRYNKPRRYTFIVGVDSVEEV